MVPTISNVLLKALVCTDVTVGEYLRDDTGVDCQSAGYAFFFIVDVILLVIYQALPLIYIILLVEVSAALQDKRKGWFGSRGEGR